MRAFAERHADEPRNVAAKAYEREYGFSAGIAAIWLDLFAEPADVSFSEWLGVEVAECPTGAPASRADVPVAHDTEREAPTLEGFLARELAGRICDEGLVRRRFAFEFPDDPPEALDRGIEDAGYYEDRGLLFREGSTPNDHFTRLLAEHPSFAKGDAGFENAVWQHPAFRQVLRQALSDHRLLLYEGDITRYVRDFGSVAGTDAEADLKAAELQAMSELLEKMGPDALTREKVSELRSDGNLVDGFKRAGDRARETVRRVKLMDTPAKKSADCLSELEKILPEMLDVLGPDELEKVRRNLVAVADKVEELIGEIDERA